MTEEHQNNGENGEELSQAEQRDQKGDAQRKIQKSLPVNSVFDYSG